MTATSLSRRQLSAAERRALLARLLDEQRAGRVKRAPVSFSQRRLWFLDQLAPGSAFYHVDIALRLPNESALNDDAFVRTITDIVRRHESLRTTFEAVDGEPVQVIAPAPGVRPQIADLRHLALADQEDAAVRTAAELTERPFDLARGPLMRVALLKLHDHCLLLLVMHHIICDGWSMGVFTREYEALYAAHCAAVPATLPELPIQYSDYAAWQQTSLHGDGMESQVRYWTEQLRNLQPLELPTDRPRPRVQAFRGAYEPVRIAGDVVERLRSLGTNEGATLFMILLSAFHVLLARYSGQEDIAVGTYIANRNRAEVEHLIGFFINTLVIRTSTAGNPSFREFLARVRETALAAYANQDAPFEVVVEALHPERDLSRNPLFQVVFQLFNAPNVETRSARAGDITPLVEKRTAIFDVAFSLWETSDGLGGGFEYNTDLFDARTIRRMIAHYQTVLASIADDPSQPITELRLLSEHERRQYVVEWNMTHRELDPRRSVMSLFWSRVNDSADRVALTQADERLTFREVGERVTRLASHLARHGARPERLVGICLDRSVNAVVSMLATFEAGAGFVPLNPHDPAERHDFIVRDANLVAIVTNSYWARSVRGGQLARVELDRFDWSPDAAPPTTGTRVSDTPLNRLAYAMYTSGSTGRPKGVLAEHRQIVNRLEWMWREYPFGQNDVSCHKTSLTFIDSLWEILGPLLQGIPTVIVPEHVGRDPRTLLETFADGRVTRVWLVPTLLRELLDVLETDSELTSRLSRLTFWVSSGEPLSVALAERFDRVLPAATLYNLYGTSEIWDATWHDPRRDIHHSGYAPIGRPIDNVQAYVLGTGALLPPIGVAGELCIGGAGLARGYLNLPELTNERFVAHPFVPGARLYRTGDAARYLPDGQIEYVGRLDRQVKLRGFRIEPGEIEAVLDCHPAIRENAVIVHEANGDKQLTAYVVARSDWNTSRDELIAFLQGRLPAHMIPAFFVFLEDLPKTTSGKVNRLALPLVAASHRCERRERVPPRSALEAIVVQLYEQVLATEGVGVHDHFFRELGGHSLLATRLASRVRNALAIDVPLQTLFEACTPAALAAAIEAFTALPGQSVLIAD